MDHFDEEDVDYDALVKAITRAKEKVSSDHPPNLTVTSMPTDICFHPDQDLLAVATYDNDIEIYKYSNEENKSVGKVDLGEDVSCREMCFSGNGEDLFAALNNSNLVHFNAELEVIRTYEGHTESPANAILEIDEYRLAIGTDDGFVHIWDQRQPDKTTSLDVCDGEITSMVCDEEGKTLVCTSADGIIASIKVRAGKVAVKSEEYNTEFNCLGTLKQSTKLAVCDSKGDLYFFNWGDFGYHIDMIPLHKDCINEFIPITEKIGITACGDGKLYATHFYPKKLLGIVGEHKHSVEKMDICNDGHLIASSSLDETIKFWNVSYFEDFVPPTLKETKVPKGSAKKETKHKLPSSSQKNASQFFEGLK